MSFVPESRDRRPTCTFLFCWPHDSTRPGPTVTNLSCTAFLRDLFPSCPRQFWTAGQMSSTALLAWLPPKLRTISAMAVSLALRPPNRWACTKSVSVTFAYRRRKPVWCHPHCTSPKWWHTFKRALHLRRSWCFPSRCGRTLRKSTTLPGRLVVGGDAWTGSQPTSISPSHVFQVIAEDAASTCQYPSLLRKARPTQWARTYDKNFTIWTPSHSTISEQSARLPL